MVLRLVPRVQAIRTRRRWLAGRCVVINRASRYQPPPEWFDARILDLYFYAPPLPRMNVRICRGQGQTSRAWRETWPCPGSRLASETPAGA